MEVYLNNKVIQQRFLTMCNDDRLCHSRFNGMLSAEYLWPLRSASVSREKAKCLEYYDTRVA